MQCTVFIGTSLDGFIARTDGAIDWLTDPGPDAPPAGAPGAAADEEPGGEGHAGAGPGGEEPGDFGYHAFFDTVDALVMGRNTYETVRAFGEWPYGDKPVIVLTSREIEIPAGLAATVEAMNAPPREVVRRLGERGMRHLYIDGGRTIQRFLAEGLIQRLIITRLPILIGSGIPLFGPLDRDVRLRHLGTTAYRNGFVQSRYEVI